MDFTQKYGPWALVAGASEGIGAAYASQLAAKGLNLLLIARRPGPLEDLALDIRRNHGVDVRTAALDLGSNDLASRLDDATADLDIGLCVYNAAASNLGHFVDVSLANKMSEIDVNVSGPMRLLDAIVPALVARGRGGVILMTSIAGTSGSAVVATYAATKSFMRVLAEGLWAELKPEGVDVLACVAGATDTPNYQATKPDGNAPTQSPDDVVKTALDALGKGPVVISGRTNKIVSFVFGRLLPKSLSVRLMSAQLEQLYGDKT
jgi:short-subunit dehydrogenase